MRSVAKMGHLVVFEDKDTPSVLEHFGFNVDKDGHILDRDGIQVLCPYCGEPLTVDNLGGVFPPANPPTLVCDNTVCVLKHLDSVGFSELDL